MPDDMTTGTANGIAGAATMASATGEPRFNSRLGDKVLAAFNHAYATGALDVARQLREILARLESDHAETRGERRYSSTTLSQADLWMAFVEARNDYQAACGSDDGVSPAGEAALAAMKSAYDAWLLG